ncbi:MAG: hypothetical protein K0Q90_1042 [Paenibacillaceae bacterium]|jgi:fermentation-respiration switch protein FrsA (DUF1100 family)|nr:hypothetical protein [Paenibacillaceae bacterium]
MMMKKEERYVYVLLTDSGTVLGRMIKWYTKQPLSHASLVLDQELQEIYSFGRKNPGNPFIGGFVRESLKSGLLLDASCALYRCSVSSSVYTRLQHHVEEMRSHQDEYKYSVWGLVGVALNRAWSRENAYFCSQFVATVLEENGAVRLEKPPALTTPGDLAALDELAPIFRGSVRQLLEQWREAATQPHYSGSPRHVARSRHELAAAGAAALTTAG